MPGDLFGRTSWIWSMRSIVANDEKILRPDLSSAGFQVPADGITVDLFEARLTRDWCTCVFVE